MANFVALIWFLFNKISEDSSFQKLEVEEAKIKDLTVSRNISLPKIPDVLDYYTSINVPNNYMLVNNC